MKKKAKKKVTTAAMLSGIVDDLEMIKLRKVVLGTKHMIADGVYTINNVPGKPPIPEKVRMICVWRGLVFVHPSLGGQKALWEAKNTDAPKAAVNGVPLVLSQWLAENYPETANFVNALLSSLQGDKSARLMLS